MTEISSTIFNEENKVLLNFIRRRIKQGKQYAFRIDGEEDPLPQFRTNPLIRPITEDIIARIKNKSPRFSKMISERIGSSFKSAAITYHCFVYTILDDFGYHHFEVEDGKTMPLNPTSFSKIFELRRATFQQELNPASKANAKKKATKGRKKYVTHDFSYRYLKLDEYKVREKDSNELKESINILTPIYNEIIDSILE